MEVSSRSTERERERGVLAQIFISEGQITNILA